jgi:hypothetical protein
MRLGVSSHPRRFTVPGAAALLVLLLIARNCLADMLVQFQPPHIVRTPAATFDPTLKEAVDRTIADASITSVRGLVEFSLSRTRAQLHFGLDHPTTLTFRAEEREGNCIEYSQLFATVFNRAAERKRIAARAYVVHSDARVLGRRLAGRGLGDHDWVLVVPAARGSRLFVDPTFDDLGLHWDIARSVRGDSEAREGLVVR